MLEVEGVLVHGIIFFELKRFAESLGPGMWWSLMNEARLEGRLYLPLRVYPDSDLRALVTAAARLRQQQETHLLEAFGHYLSPRLLDFYQVLTDPGWTTLDVLEHAEQSFYRTIKRTVPEIDARVFTARRLRPDEVEVTYHSQRRLCALARGMIRGLADHFGEQVVVHEVECMLSGADRCKMIVTRTGPFQPEPEPRAG